eukprot:TRINITY_DN7532_c0_g2_i9.p1 TRINITY_DN7532_c0_g2~~TRINITY_DN7532_c0_g2_i9.p1  ORF type:complete len:375 (+),score=68.76 TRINITY_DN7532_c0_g2_i9:68-1126(+)
MFSAVRSGARRVQHSLTTPVERGRRVTAMGLAASGAVYLYVLTRCGYHTIVHADTGSGDLWNSGVIPAGIAGSVLMVTTVWAVLFTGMAVSSGFSWGHVHHARDNAFLLYHYPCDAKRRAAILEWIHFADLTAQNQHDYHDLYTDTRRRPPVRFVPDPREFKDMDLQETSITGEELVTCPEDEKRLASRSFVPEFYCAGKTDDWSEKDICYWALCDTAAAGLQQKIDTLRSAYMHSPRGPVWTFEDGQRHWFDGSFLKVAKPAGSFRGRLRMVMASVLRNLPEAVALVVQANIARFVLQSLTLYMVLWYAGIPLSKVPEAEFNARNVEVYARCVLMDVFQSWGHVQQVLSWL